MSKVGGVGYFCVCVCGGVCMYLGVLYVCPGLCIKVLSDRCVFVGRGRRGVHLCGEMIIVSV